MFFLKKSLRKFSKIFFSTKKGTATGISLGFSAGLLMVSAGAATFVDNTLKENRDLEGATVSYYAAERGVEYALFDLAGHLPGYELGSEDGTASGKLKSPNKKAKTQVTITSRAEESETTITLPIQQKGQGTSTDNDDWNALPQGKTLSIPLYIDNTGKRN